MDGSAFRGLDSLLWFVIGTLLALFVGAFFLGMHVAERARPLPQFPDLKACSPTCWVDGYDTPGLLCKDGARWLYKPDSEFKFVRVKD